MVERIVFIVDNPFTKRDLVRFGVQTLLDNGFRVEVWEITPILYPHVHSGYVRDEGFRYEGHRLYHALPGLKKEISRLSESDFVITFISYYYKSLGVYRSVGRSAARYAISMATTLPRPGHGKPSTFIKKLTIFFRSRLFRTAFELVFQRLPLRFVGVRRADFILASGGKTLGFRDKGPAGPGAEVIWAHAFDYDRYLDMLKEPPRDRGLGKYAVFLDEYLPFHHDFIMTGDIYGGYADVYYPALRKLFEFVEKETGLRVVVAAHPSSRYEESPDYFGGRRVIRGETLDLVRGASLVILQCSTALNFAVLFRKPLLFITNSVYERRYEGLIIRELSRIFGTKPIDIESDLPGTLGDALKVDEGAYGRYIEDYIKTPGTLDLPFWQIVANRLKKL